MKRPLIFLTNDDGVNARGLNLLIEAVRPYGRLIVVAPETVQSGMGHAITSNDPLYLRTVKEAERGMIEGAVNIPLDSIRGSLSMLDRSKTIYVYCRSGLRSYIGARILQGHGFRARSLSGGYLFYSLVSEDRKKKQGESAIFSL